MRQPARRAAVSVVTAAALLFGLSGCSKTVSRSDVEKAIQNKLVEQNSSHKVGEVDCDDDLKAKVDASTTCTAVIDGHKKTYKAVVTRVDDSGDRVHYTIKDADK